MYMHRLLLVAACTTGQLSVWPSGLRRCVQVAVHFCGREFESHSWQTPFSCPLCVCAALFLTANQIYMKSLTQPSMDSRVAQWKRAGPITQRSVDRNYALLRTNSFLFFCFVFFLSIFFRRRQGPQMCPSTVTRPISAEDSALDF